MLVKCLGNNTPTPSPPLKFQKLNQMSDSDSGNKLRKKNLVKFLGDSDRSPWPVGPQGGPELLKFQKLNLISDLDSGKKNKNKIFFGQIFG